ncbi:hypothetical protein CLF_110160 [Clonorchis sinensis]|uniref:Uncharacterized protein n=1 Tax=Clonorchis sinensis TaxID=79923 RepID=G7YKC9_CLOSI|nr:hypothetical protein CLF_110160 [Clonorchis sinensis]
MAVRHRTGATAERFEGNNSPTIDELITMHRLRWLGHVLCMPVDRLLRKVLLQNYAKSVNEPEAVKNDVAAKCESVIHTSNSKLMPHRSPRSVISRVALLAAYSRADVRLHTVSDTSNHEPASKHPYYHSQRTRTSTTSGQVVFVFMQPPNKNGQQFGFARDSPGAQLNISFVMFSGLMFQLLRYSRYRDTCSSSVFTGGGRSDGSRSVRRAWQLASKRFVPSRGDIVSAQLSGSTSTDDVSSTGDETFGSQLSSSANISTAILSTTSTLKHDAACVQHIQLKNSINRSNFLKNIPMDCTEYHPQRESSEITNKNIYCRHITDEVNDKSRGASVDYSPRAQLVDFSWSSWACDCCGNLVGGGKFAESLGLRLLMNNRDCFQRFLKCDPIIARKWDWTFDGHIGSSCYNSDHRKRECGTYNEALEAKDSWSVLKNPGNQEHIAIVSRCDRITSTHPVDDHETHFQSTL